jgi:hypothetical protein
MLRLPCTNLSRRTVCVNTMCRVRNFVGPKPFTRNVGVRRQLRRVLGVFLLWAVAGAGSAIAAPVLTWSPPRLIDRALPLGHTDTLTGVSCPTTAMCVAVGDNLFTSTNPEAASWQKASLPASAVSCPSTSLCVAAAQGHVLWSVDPSGGASAWNSAAVDGGRQLTSISCPSTQLCVAADNRGYVLTSTDPTGGAGAWAASQVSTSLDEPGMFVSCASDQLCVAVYGGLVLTSTDPAGGSAAWSSAQVEPQDPRTDQVTPMTGLACPSASLCIAIDDAGNVLTSTNPTGGAGAWRLVSVDGGTPLRGVACATTSLCVVADQAGNVITSINPTGSDAAWSAPAIVASDDECSIRGCDRGLPPPNGSPQADPVVACPSTSLCVMVDQFGVVITSSSPTSGPGIWKPARVDPHTEAPLHFRMSPARPARCAQPWTARGTS